MVCCGVLWCVAVELRQSDTAQLAPRPAEAVTGKDGCVAVCCGVLRCVVCCDVLHVLQLRSHHRARARVYTHTFSLFFSPYLSISLPLSYTRTQVHLATSQIKVDPSVHRQPPPHPPSSLPPFSLSLFSTLSLSLSPFLSISISLTPHSLSLSHTGTPSNESHQSGASSAPQTSRKTPDQRCPGSLQHTR